MITMKPIKGFKHWFLFIPFGEVTIDEDDKLIESRLYCCRNAIIPALSRFFMRKKGYSTFFSCNTGDFVIAKHGDIDDSFIYKFKLVKYSS